MYILSKKIKNKDEIYISSSTGHEATPFIENAFIFNTKQEVIKIVTAVKWWGELNIININEKNKKENKMNLKNNINLYKEILKVIKLEVDDNDISDIELELVQMKNLAEVITEHIENKLSKIDRKRTQELLDFIRDDFQIYFTNEVKTVKN